jgi:hypothetical protein
MRRSRLGTILGGALIAALLVPSAALAGAAPAGGEALAPAAHAVPAIRLGCALVIPVPRDTRPAVVCRWSALEGADVKVYRLWRIEDAGPRQLIARVAPGDPLRHADRDIARGHTYAYRVVGIGSDGSRLGVSRLVRVTIGRPAETLRFNCAFVVDGDVRGVRCRWGESNRPAAVRYVLYRSVDGAARERIYRVGLNGRRGYLDTDVVAGQTIRYAVVALAADGRVVGIGGPDAVTIPALTPTAVAR